MNTHDTEQASNAGAQIPPPGSKKKPPKIRSSQTRLIPVPRWSDHHDWPPIGGLRHLIFYSQSNGFARCIRRVGRRVLIDEAAFFEWVEAINSER